MRANTFYSFLIILFLLSCNQQKEINETFIISGQVSNIKDSSTFEVSSNSIDTSFLIYEDQSFSFQLPLTKTNYLRFVINNEYGTIYAEPGDSIYFTTNYEQFDEALNFGGSKKLENDFLIQNYLTKEKNLLGNGNYNKKEFVEFYSDVEKEQQQTRNLLHKFNEQGLSEDFYEREKKRLKLEFFERLLYYPHKYNFANKKQPQLPDEYFQRLEEFDLTDPEFLEFENFEAAAIEKLRLQEPELSMKNEDFYTEMVDRIKALAQNEIQEHILYKLLNYQIIHGRDQDVLKQNHEYFLNVAKDENLKKKITNLVDRKSLLSKGNPAQNFTGIDFEGNEKSLIDLGGQIVFINFWATWCEPCKSEIPYINKLAEQYSENITILNVCLDTGPDAISKWSEYLNRIDLKGEQIIIHEEFKQLQESYLLRTIPRYVLIDEKGHFIHANCPRPSEKEKLEALINSVF